MSDCQSSPTKPTTILGVNKKLNDSLAAINNRFQLLENKLEAFIENSNQCFDKAEKDSQDISQLLLDIRREIKEGLNRSGGSVDPINSPEEIDHKSAKGKEKEIPESSHPKNPDYTDSDAIKRNTQGRLDTSATNDIGENLTLGERFVKRAWPEAVFPNDLNNKSYTSIKNKVVLKPEWQLVVANSEVFTKLSSIQNALHLALIPYHLWAH
ncbi:BgtAc-30005 [Blumeria graminis f. sp. tritici]|uniref:Uncharacterized protein n=3 Tax=Blumeria graminis f. sp. tritici TaxID=62690 RepID=A0A656KEW1_BLUGR|nr:hypothetical protein BGT96224_Ac30005 [Blumeria graminis f. sp. tritici 96224]VCU40911.1 BgtAc-30005 [Blumeria graminis f. sp. tritici]